MKRITLLLSLLFAVSAMAANQEGAKEESTEAEFDALGGNKILLDKAKALEPEKSISIVQNRTVSLENRVEIAPEFSGTFGGDTYTRTKSIGLNAFYHFNPRWAIGAKYNYSFNSMTPEGESLVNQAYEQFKKDPANPTLGYPQMDYPKSETMALFNYSPIYGKLNLFDKSIAHFDVYLLGGYGQVALSSGGASTYTAGGGLGFWVSRHFSTRFEMRYQSYTAKYFETQKKMDLAVASVQMGWLL
ncbi:MAG TPA: outer membrane beta-barrel domain-containing protein [Pseudobdellovibrionaceae bacterium]|jgi:outer membrane beta-barrel protein